MESFQGELIQHIFDYLGLDDLCQASTTCTLFRRHCYDPLLNMELNLQPYWRVVSQNYIVVSNFICDGLL